MVATRVACSCTLAGCSPHARRHRNSPMLHAIVGNAMPPNAELIRHDIARPGKDFTCQGCRWSTVRRLPMSVVTVVTVCSLTGVGAVAGVGVVGRRRSQSTDAGFGLVCLSTLRWTYCLREVNMMRCSILFRDTVELVCFGCG